MGDATKLAFAVFLFSCSSGAILGRSETKQCAYYNSNWEKERTNRSGIEPCRGEEDKRRHCFATWKNVSGVVEVVKQGCWLDDVNCYDSSECLEKKESPDVFFCCCEGNMCNEKFLYAPEVPQPGAPHHSTAYTTSNPFSQKPQLFSTLLYSLVPIIGLAAVVLFSFWMWRHHKLAYPAALVPTHDPGPSPPSPILGHKPLQLIEVKARGRYGCVWKAQLLNDFVAVKIFPIQDKLSWQNEYEIFSLSGMKHDNILHFIGAEKRNNNLDLELWLITSYHDKGSMTDFLKANVVSWNELCHITQTTARGLAYLHEDIPGHKDGHKPSIAHRDIKSKNVLLKSNLTACIADFGLALQFEAGKSAGDTHGQVGTRRYMAPEVLGGALDLRDCASALKQVDVYALGLLYWESFRRCSQLFTGEAVPEHQLAFQAELGNHPSFQEMQILVNRNKFRPRFPESWRSSSPALSSLMETMEDCWDPDAEARLTAQCAEERLCDLTLHSHRIGPPPVGPASSQDLGVVKNLHGDDFASSVVKTTTSGAEASGRNSITHTGGAVPRVCLQRTQEDLDTSKLDPEQVDQNLNLSFDARVMEDHHPAELLNYQVLQSLALQGELGAAGSSSLHPLPKQQNLPQRPTSLHLQNPDPASCRLKLGRHRSNLKQVETGIAKMNTVTVATATEPHQVTTVTKTSVTHGYSAGVPVLVVNSLMLMEDEENRTNLLNPSLDEHAPLLRRDPDLHQASETRSNVNNNNNNNRIQPQGLRPEPHLESQSSSKPEPPLESQSSKPEPHLESQSSKPEPHLDSELGPCVIRSLCIAPVLVPVCRDPDPGSAKPPGATSSSRAGPSAAQNLDPAPGDPKPAAFGSLEDLESTESPALEPAGLRERPWSLNLSSSGLLSDSSLKIKRRVKTPYTLKKWRPASWGVPSEATSCREFSRQRAGSVSRVRPSRATTSDPNSCF